MSQQYNLYNILFEEASKKPDLKARVQAMKAARDSATGPTSKIDTARGMSIPDLVQSGQKELKAKVEKLSKVADAIKPSEKDVEQAKEAAKKPVQERLDKINQEIAGYKEVLAQVRSEIDATASLAEPLISGNYLGVIDTLISQIGRAHV